MAKIIQMVIPNFVAVCPNCVLVIPNFVQVSLTRFFNVAILYDSGIFVYCYAPSQKLFSVHTADLPYARHSSRSKSEVRVCLPA